MSIDIIKFKNTDKKENISNLSSNSLQVGELALVRETNYERLYTKNTDGEVTPLNRIYDAGEIPLPTIQTEWIDTGLARWAGDATAMNQVRFNTDLTGDFTPPEVSDMDRLTTMDSMFSGIFDLTSLDLSTFDTSNVTYMGRMFQNCSGLTSLDLSNWNTSKVTNMGNMFQSCEGLTSLDLSNFNTSNVTYIAAMFAYCTDLTSLNVSNWDTSNVTDMSSMFAGCSGLTLLDLSNFKTSNVGSMSLMFSNCTNLTMLDLSNFIVSEKTDIMWMFSGCEKLNQITCKRTFKDWCQTDKKYSSLPDAMKEGGSGTWIIVP